MKHHQPQESGDTGQSPARRPSFAPRGTPVRGGRRGVWTRQESERYWLPRRSAPALIARMRPVTGRPRAPRGPQRLAVLMIWLLGCPVASVAQVAVPPSPDRGYIGLGWSFPLAVEEDESGVMRASGYSVVVQVDKCSPAEKAGFQAGDVLKVVSGRDGRIVPLFEGIRPGTVHIVTVERGEEVLDLTMTIEEPLGEGETPADRCDEKCSQARCGRQPDAIAKVVKT